VGLGAIAVLVIGSAAVAYSRVSDASGASPIDRDDTSAAEGSGQALAAGPSGSAGPSASGSASASASASAGKAQAQTPGGFPNASNTGVPSGTKLSIYSGPCTIQTDNTVVDSKTVNCETFEVRARNVKISKSRINGIVVTSERTNFSFTMDQTEVVAGLVARAAVGSTNMTITRSDITGGRTTVACSFNCTVRDSYLHGQELPAGSDWHVGAFLANDAGPNGRTEATLTHNTIICDAKETGNGGGCSGDINLFPDFGPVSYITVDGNLFGANTDISYCVYGGTATTKQFNSGVRNIVFTNNVWQRGSNKKCGFWGPVTSFNPSLPGNRWENNKWDDGTNVESAN
jgi:hypothetical protein